jgi:hypothetical protein
MEYQMKLSKETLESIRKKLEFDGRVYSPERISVKLEEFKEANLNPPEKGVTKLICIDWYGQIHYNVSYFGYSKYLAFANISDEASPGLCFECLNHPFKITLKSIIVHYWTRYADVEIIDDSIKEGDAIWIVDNGVPTELICTGNKVDGYDEFITPHGKKVNGYSEDGQTFKSLHELITFIANDLTKKAEYNNN